ncbi:hypothetical protein GF362_05070 [Candidatus Dojkabacteria bacterium]|nr:hypothetical protein [Candidatus Dojkabacteria bacterium]
MLHQEIPIEYSPTEQPLPPTMVDIQCTEEEGTLNICQLETWGNPDEGASAITHPDGTTVELNDWICEDNSCHLRFNEELLVCGSEIDIEPDYKKDSGGYIFRLDDEDLNLFTGLRELRGPEDSLYNEIIYTGDEEECRPFSVHLPLIL